MNIRFIGIVMVIALIQSCINPVGQDVNYLIRIKIKSDTEIPFTDSSRIKIKLYAYDKNVSDAPATNLKTIDTKISSVNGEYTLEFNSDDFESVQPSSGGGEYRFYFSFTIDLNNDGKICTGDYIQDYEKSPSSSYSNADSGEKKIELYTKEVISGNCYEF